MLISVIIPVYKVEAYLKECVDSVLSQSYKDIEVLLVDDGSPDRCPEICDEYAQMDSRVRVIHKKNGGLSDARNEGLEQMTGDYVIFLDSDDWWVDNKVVEDLVELINAHNVDVVLFDRITYTSDGKVHYPNTDTLKKINDLPFDDAVFELSKQGKFDISAATKIVRSSIINSNNIRFVNGLFSEDFDWTFNLFLYVQSLAGLNRPVYCYRKRQGSITASVGIKNIRDHLGIVEDWAPKVLHNSKYSSRMKLALLGELSYHYYISRSYIVRNNVKTASYAELHERIHKLDWLQKYSLSRKTRLAYYCSRLLGKKLSSKLMSFYIRTKDRFIKL